MYPMNKTLIASFAMVAALSASAQGTFLFNNSALDGKPRIFAPDGTTGLTGSAGYLVDVVVAGATSLTDANTGLALQPLKFFNSAANAGLFSGTTVVVGGITTAGATASVTVRAWDGNTGATYDKATVKGSVTFTQTGFGGFGSPPANPVAFTGFTSFALKSTTVVPEPSTYALAALGLGGLLFLRRK